jgi:thioredoxin 1
VGPILDQIDKENPDISVFKVDIDDDPTGLTSEFGVRNIPTLLYFKNGEMIEKTVGSLPKTMILSKFNK